MPTQFDPPSGTRDFLAREFETRERAFALIRSVFDRYGFEPLATPAFERLDATAPRIGLASPLRNHVCKITLE